MASMLEEIANAARIRVVERKDMRPLEHIKARAERMAGPTESGAPGTGAYETLQEAIRRNGLSVIAEVKKANPGEGLVCEDFASADIAYDCESAGVDALAYVAEPHWYYGSDEEFVDIRNDVSVPLLYRDFVVDEYQIYEAKCFGADAVNLVCGILDDERLNAFVRLCNDLHMDVVVEAANAEEVERAVRSQALIIAVNNRDMSDMSLDIGKAIELRSLVPDDCLFVAESGIASPDDGRRLFESGVDAVLIGNHFMKAADEDVRQDLIRDFSEIR